MKRYFLIQSRPTLLIVEAWKQTAWNNLGSERLTIARAFLFLHN